MLYWCCSRPKFFLPWSAPTSDGNFGSANLAAGLAATRRTATPSHRAETAFPSAVILPCLERWSPCRPAARPQPDIRSARAGRPGRTVLAAALAPHPDWRRAPLPAPLPICPRLEVQPDLVALVPLGSIALSAAQPCSSNRRWESGWSPLPTPWQAPVGSQQRFRWRRWFDSASLPGTR